jgi:signal-transduction protein with cAMP-binding, CBS, and nucleotidyltransferase domain
LWRSLLPAGARLNRRLAQKVSERMTSAPVSLSSSQTVANAARAMHEAGIGDVLVTDDGQLKSMAADRDIVACSRGRP